jgi:alpha-mannosidase
MKTRVRLSSCLLKCGMILMMMVTMSSAELPKTVYLVSNFHPACCGWLADWSTERNYCANTYLDHLDRVRDDAHYAFALSEVPNMIAILNFHKDRVAELKERIKEGRVELCNAFFLEPTINLSGGEALVKNGIEGLRWQSQVLGFKPRFAWMIDVTGTHEQMAQITAGLGLDALFYTRHNPTGYALHWIESPDGSRVPAISPGHYSEWNPLFKSKEPLSDQQISEMIKDVEYRANPVPLSEEAIEKRRNIWSGTPPRAPRGTPVLILGGSGDYSTAPPYKGYPTEFIKQFEALAPGTRFLFATPSQYLNDVMPGIKDNSIPLRTMKGSTAFSFNAFWIENPRVKQSFRNCEQGLQAAEMLATAASLRSGFAYPTQSLYHAWLMMLLNMDRNSLWGSAGGMVFESATSWDVKDRYESVKTIYNEVMQQALTTAPKTEQGIGFFNFLNWNRQDPVIVPLEKGKQLKNVTCQSEPGLDAIIAMPALKSTALAVLESEDRAAPSAKTIELPEIVETKYYRVHIDPETGAITSLKLKASDREMLGGPANVIVAEKPKIQNGEPGDHIVDRQDRETLTTSSRFKPSITVTSGQLATTVTLVSDFYGGGKMVRTARFYDDYPRIDFQTELNDIPDRTVVVAEFPLAEDISEIRRGIPYGFSQAAWSKANTALQGWSKGIVPAVRWSHYSLEQGGGVAILDRGLSGREITGRTPIIFLLNATDTYYGYPNSWLSGKGKHILEYALVAHETGWENARIPQLAWEFNCPVYVFEKPSSAKEISSILSTSDNVIVEAVRREGDEIEIRMAEAFGRSGEAELKLLLPHRAARITNLVGQTLQQLKPTGAYHFPVRPQQIVTIRFKTEQRVADVIPLTDWNPLVPEHKRATLNTYIDKKGHPPRGDQK